MCGDARQFQEMPHCLALIATIVRSPGCDTPLASAPHKRSSPGTAMPVPSPTLAANVMHFARLLRRAGLPVGPAETLAAQQALSVIDLASKTEARTALRAAMIHRHEHQDVFDQAFA